MEIRIDLEQDTFLLDHVVDGAPLLPTVMQLDLVARGLTAMTAAGNGAVAVAAPRPAPSHQGRVFDGQVVAPSGTVLLAVAGYQATDLGGPANLRPAARLIRCLASHPEPARPGRAGTAIPEGAQR